MLVVASVFDDGALVAAVAEGGAVAEGAEAATGGFGGALASLISGLYFMATLIDRGKLSCMTIRCAFV